MSTFYIIATTLFAIYLILVGWHTLRSLRYSPLGYSPKANNYWIKSAEILFLLMAPILGFIRYQEFQTTGEVVFSPAHLPTLIALAALGGMSFWVSRFFKYNAPPWLTILLPLGLIQGILINLILVIHFGKYMLLGAVFPLLGFELIAPLFNVIFISRELYHQHLALRQHVKNEPIYSTNYLVLGLFFLMDTRFFTKLRICMVLFVPAFLFQITLLVLCGQSPDAIVQVFTDTKGFTFSSPGKRTVEIFMSFLK
ncbi:hypothetical protein BKI52_39995 [marine bacterium AO1-C]|nr:hypothetical protein BKI52_39995 [marine bacterium AO1-C]